MWFTGSLQNNRVSSKAWVLRCSIPPLAGSSTPYTNPGYFTIKYNTSAFIGVLTVVYEAVPFQYPAGLLAASVAGG